MHHFINEKVIHVNSDASYDNRHVLDHIYETKKKSAHIFFAVKRKLALD